MAEIAIDFSVKHGIGVRDPLASKHPWYVLMELSSPREDAARHAGGDPGEGHGTTASSMTP